MALNRDSQDRENSVLNREKGPGPGKGIPEPGQSVTDRENSVLNRENGFRTVNSPREPGQLVLDRENPAVNQERDPDREKWQLGTGIGPGKLGTEPGKGSRIGNGSWEPGQLVLNREKPGGSGKRVGEPG
ncbi:hypothetical protein TURU_002324 [Turdus rufiventris]|nr:hypothetical protein TURU_002324 [Turdus rufiventris]